MAVHEDDQRWLMAAIRLGSQQLGQTWPNPAVGCIIMKAGRVVGSGVTGKGGRPHGEVVGLESAGTQAKGATVYVSLEPCNHHGKTPPCTNALIAAGVARVVIAHGDPDPRVAGSGAQRLREAGIEVDFEPSKAAKSLAQRVHAGHFTRVTLGRPHVTLKLALSRDGGMGLAGQGQVPITSHQTNAMMHGLRSRRDAIAVGAGTWRADTPQLNVRLAGLAHRSPRRVVFGTVDVPDDVCVLPGHDLAASLASLAQQGITNVLVEGGAKIANALLAGSLVDQMILLQGNVELGANALRPFPANPFDSLADAGLATWRLEQTRSIGVDRMLVLAPTP